MFGRVTDPATFELREPCRVLSSVEADTDNTRFFVGSASLREQNHLHVLHYDSDKNRVSTLASLDHPGECWALAPHPNSPSLLISGAGNAVGGNQATALVWKFEGLEDKEDSDDEGARGASVVTGAIKSTIPVSAKLAGASWSRQKDKQMLLAYGTTVETWDIDRIGAQPMARGTLKRNRGIQAVLHDPHHANIAVVAVDSVVNELDLRTMEPTKTIPEAHTHCVRSVDYSPNKPWFICTGGDDGAVKFWDLRNVSTPVKVLCSHSHWIWRAKYNRFHDQLLLSASSDTSVCLWRASSISSAPLLDMEENEEKAPPDALVKQYQWHEDSVYDVAWSPSSAWHFGTLSFAGRVVVGQVPSTEMYKILL